MTYEFVVLKDGVEIDRLAAEGAVLVLNSRERYEVRTFGSVLQVFEGRRPLVSLAPGVRLTDRELQILELAAEGLTGIQTAARLSFAESTIKRVRRSILDKLGVDTMIAAVSLAQKMGVIK